ncbi:Mob1-like_protein [Hexamita inflata]|uniref:Mob1-like protein n=1 Tax=Hexamita inflata TaxID=28002 RepID=A0AA86PPC0_9EUKA|nr:Mob1-like protein [Hexamita inflata]
MFNKTTSTIVREPGHETVKNIEIDYTFSESQIDQQIQCPKDTDINDFISFNLCELVEDSQSFFLFVKGQCKMECDTMCAGQGNKYLWQVGQDKPQELKAVDYCNCLYDQITENLQNPKLFPITEPYPKDFLKYVKQMFRRLFRVFMHCYCSHFDLIYKSGMEQKLQYQIKYFAEFMKKYQLCEIEDLEPIKHLLDQK